MAVDIAVAVAVDVALVYNNFDNTIYTRQEI